jgi:hypothetical protein
LSEPYSPVLAATASVAGAVVVALVVPALASRPGASGLRRAALATGAVLALVGLIAMVDAGPGSGLRALPPLLGLGVLAVGLSRLLQARPGLPPAAASATASLLSLALLVLPFLGDALVEPGGPGGSSPTAISALVGGSPLSASVGNGLGVDFLHAPRAYGGDEADGLSRIGAFYAYRYPSPWAAMVGLGLTGLVLLGLSSLRKGHSEPEAPDENRTPVPPAA